MHDLNPAELETKAPGWHADGGGLFLVVTNAGSRSWAVKYSVKGAGGDRKTMGLGGFPAVTLKAARLAAEKVRNDARAGTSPKAKATAAADLDRAIPTFGAFADQLLPKYVKGLKNRKTVEKWQRDLGIYAQPIRDLRVDLITSSQVLALLEPHYERAPSMARELRQRLERVFSASMATPSQEKPYRAREKGNPAARKDNLEHFLPRLKPRGKQRGPQPSMPYAQLPGFMAEIAEGHGIVAKALALVILTALRTDEVRELVWSEVDFDHAVIRLAKRRMKNNWDAEVPLSPPALAMLADLKRDAFADHVFPGRKPGAPISSDAMLKYLQTGKPSRPDCTVHGFRTSFRSWGDDQDLGHSRETLEFCLHHIEGGEAERAYRQGRMLEKRRAALNDWAKFVTSSKPRKLRLVA
jgi:integrase